MTGEKNRFTTAEKLWNLDDKQLKSPVHDAMVLWLMDETNLKALLEKQCKSAESTIYSDEKYNINEIYNVSLSIESEKPIMSSKTFIAGYADLIVDFKYEKCISHEKCPIDKKWYIELEKVAYWEDMELLLKKYFNDENFKAKEFPRDYPMYECYFNIIDGVLQSVPESDFDKENGIIKHRYNCIDCKVDIFDVLADFWLNIFENSSFNRHTKEWMRTGNKYTMEYCVYNCLIEVKPYIDSFGAVLRQIKSYKQFYHGGYRIYDENNKYLYYNNIQYCIFTFDDRFDKQFESQGITVLHPWIGEKYMLQLYGFE